MPLIKIASLLFLLAWNAYFFTADIGLKWYLQSERHSDKFSVTIDAGKVSRYIQISGLRVVVDFMDAGGTLLSRDTMNFFPAEPGGKPSYLLSGGKVSVRTFPKPHGPDAEVRGVKLLYKWYDTSMSTDPDPFGEKVIFENTIYGEGAADVSDAPRQ